ncbi:MAG TPA: response regulator transcription factor [Terriglobales bacterium]
MRILIIEEDAPLASFLAQALAAEQYEVDVCPRNRKEGLEKDSDLVVLDLSLPSEQSVAAVQSIRCRIPTILIVVLTMRQRSEDVVRLLDAGADDYLAKPFAYAELSARIRALKRRSRLASDAVLRIGDLSLDRVQRQVARAGKVIDLTMKEFSLLEFLMRNTGRGVSRAAILEHVWKALPSPGSTNVIDVYIAYLRKKIDQGWPEKLIHTTRGVGYEISCPDRTSGSRVAEPDSAMALAGTRD